MENKQGILIAIEGIDGTGKTTQVQRLSELLTTAGEEVVVSKEPTDGKWGKLIRATAATGRLPLEEELDLFVRDRKDHISQLILPSLNAGKIVLLDRYFYSTIAYQGSRGADVERIESMMEFAPVPDMMFLLDADPQITLNRISHGRNEIPNEFEKESTLRDCREVFLKLSRSRPEVHLINATQTADLVEQELVALMLKNALQQKRCGKSNGCDVFYCSFRESGLCKWAKLKSKIGKFSASID